MSDDYDSEQEDLEEKAKQIFADKGVSLQTLQRKLNIGVNDAMRLQQKFNSKRWFTGYKIKERVRLYRDDRGYIGIQLLEDDGNWKNYGLDEFHIEGEDR